MKAGDGSKRRKRSAAEEQQRAALVMGAPLALILGGLGFAYFTGALDEISLPNEPLDMTVASYRGPKTGFHDLPEILVNIDSSGGKARLLKIRASLELADENDSAEVERSLPRIVDELHVFLRELRTTDIQGAQGLERMRREFLARVSDTLGPAMVKGVLFKEITAE